MKSLRGRNPAPIMAPYGRLSSRILRFLDFMISLYFRIWKKLATNPMVTPTQGEIYGRPTTTSLHPRFYWNVMEMTDKNRKVKTCEPIHSPKVKTTGSVTSMWTALTEELCSISLISLASSSISALLISSKKCFQNSMAPSTILENGKSEYQEQFSYMSKHFVMFMTRSIITSIYISASFISLYYKIQLMS